MRVLVCGGRKFCDAALLFWTLDRLHEIHGFSALIHGAQTGADLLGASWALYNDLEILSFPAEWTIYGRRAGPIRNLRMLNEGKPDLVVAFRGNAGTLNMIRQARDRRIRTIKAWNDDPPLEAGFFMEDATRYFMEDATR